MKLNFKNVFKRLSLSAKLTLIGLVPLILLIYLSVQLISEQEKKLDLLHGYITRIHQSSDISKLINELQTERRFSFEYALKGRLKDEMLLQRNATDSSVQQIKNNYKEALKDFTLYTFLSDLSPNRLKIDSGDMDANAVMHYYTTAIFRLNTMNIVAAGNNAYLEPLYKELESQKILSEMITYMSIIRINIYNVLYTRKYMVETLMGTLGTHDVYKTYEKEFFQKAPVAVLKSYQELMDKPAMRQTNAYIDTLFKTFKFDSTYDHQQWRNLSLEANAQLRQLQKKILDDVEAKINAIYANEEKAEVRTIVLLIVMILFGFAVIAYTIRSITMVLEELKMAAQRIADGATGLQLKKVSNDVIGSLSDSIIRIDKSNKVLADAAEAIGKGKFEVSVEPRSEDDVLGNAIVQMKNNLKQLTEDRNAMEKRKDMFITMASHELKTPVTSIQGYIQLLLKMTDVENRKTEELPGQALHNSLLTVNKQIVKLNRLITELLDLSSIETGQLQLNKEPFNLNQLLLETVSDLQQTTANHVISFQNGIEADIIGDRDRIGQVVTNLLTNAIKYSPKDRKIEVSLSRTSGSEVAVAVKDHGIGIDKDEQGKIFERFYRANGKEEQTYPGFGIGLFIANEFVQKHGGQLHVKSNKGHGSTFTFTLPTI